MPGLRRGGPRPGVRGLGPFIRRRRGFGSLHGNTEEFFATRLASGFAQKPGACSELESPMVRL